MYHKPDGALLLAYHHAPSSDSLQTNASVPLSRRRGTTAIGCAGVRRIDEQTAELKRMFVLPEFRRHRIGKQLLGRCLEAAAGLHYQKIRLDTLADMTAAQNLYRAFGFYEIPPYNVHPVPGTIFMEKRLG